MTDFILGAIIGGAIALIASVVGNVIYGRYSVKTTTLQIEAHEKEYKLQLDDKKNEARVAKLIENRSMYLNPFRKRLQSCSEPAFKLSNSITSFGVRYGNPPNPPRDTDGLDKYKKDVEELRELFQSLRPKEEQLTSMYPQITDDELLSLLFEIGSELIHISSAQYDISIPNAWLPKNMEYKEFNVDEVKKRIDRVLDKFRDANHRIEELLSGYD